MQYGEMSMSDVDIEEFNSHLFNRKKSRLHPG